MSAEPKFANPASLAGPPDQLAARFSGVRAASLALIEGLDAEDLCPQSMPDASPGKWHLAHTSWFFEAMVLEPFAGQAALRPGWAFLLNSYYEALGSRHPRPQRGLLTRPSLRQILDYREDVNQSLLAWLRTGAASAEALGLIELGLHHEQQHQELLVTDLKHLLSRNALILDGRLPAWRSGGAGTPSGSQARPLDWQVFDTAGLADIGAGDEGFSFDNEHPRHRVWLPPFAIAERPVSNGEFLEFIEAGGYRDPRWWLSDGWACVHAEGWQAPLYWRQDGTDWLRFGVDGPQPIDLAAPVSHISYYEADAYARFVGFRLPTEAEWEMAAIAGGWRADEPSVLPRDPRATRTPGSIGEVWEWTGSAYAPYPGFRTLAGAASEYNGKFMSGQMVLRGGSCASPAGHVRPSYRNFFPPQARWQFSGVRLARDPS
ncbi:MAG: ergothioneine biosynthesis protein EgtB [Xanthomonadaceae bacterium]|nr:ergothioneine biosynthesis protein EgtB [Xanthomonadaceae bacterium]